MSAVSVEGLDRVKGEIGSLVGKLGSIDHVLKGAVGGAEKFKNGARERFGTTSN